MSNRITVEQQEAMGIRRINHVTPKPQFRATENTSLVRRQPAEILPPQTPISLDVTPTASATIDMRTSAQDRAWGFLIASTPRTFIFALAITLISMLSFDIGVVVGIVLLVSIFAIVELASYIFTLAISAEGTAHYEARMKWRTLQEEQRERWKYYKALQKDQ